MTDFVRRRVFAIAAGAVAGVILTPSRLLAQSQPRALECTLKNQMVFSGRTLSYFDATAWNEGMDLRLRIELKTNVAIERPDNPSRTVGGDDSRVVMVTIFELASDSTELIPNLVYLDFHPVISRLYRPKIDVFAVGDAGLPATYPPTTRNHDIGAAGWNQFIMGKPGFLWVHDPDETIPAPISDGRDGEYIYFVLQHEADLDEALGKMRGQVLDLAGWLETYIAEGGQRDPTPGGTGASCQARSLPGSNCFLTTAAVQAVGLTDECFELRVLRRFRDTYLARSPAGRDLVRHYYATAPEIIARINARSDARRIWLAVYARYILPCALMARVGLAGPALAHYRCLLRHLTTYCA